MVFSSRTDLKLYNISVNPQKIKKTYNCYWLKGSTPDIYIKVLSVYARNTTIEYELLLLTAIWIW